MKVKKLNAIDIILILIIGFYAFKHFYYKYQMSEFEYGAKYNSTRTILNVPIIDTNMSPTNPFNEYGNRWESGKEKPKAGEVLHVWKIVSVEEHKRKIIEYDGFRKIENGRICQLNIDSEIFDGSISTRGGRTFYYDGEPREEKILNELQIDSIASVWNLFEITPYDNN